MLNSEDSILIIIDMQEKLINSVKDGHKITDNFIKIAKAADILNIPTIVTEQYPKGLGYTLDNLKSSISNGTFTVEKTSFSAMNEEMFRKGIFSLGKKQIVIGGVETHICVLQTAFDLIQNGYDVYVLKDCTSSRRHEEYDTGLDLLKNYGCKITCTEIALFEWLKDSKHPNFKDVQALIK